MAITDAQLYFSENQVVTTTGDAYYKISTNYVDLGAPGTDTWGSGVGMAPGWWSPKKLVLNVVHGAVTATVPATTSVQFFVVGVESTTYITSTPDPDNEKIFIESGKILKDNWNTNYFKLWTVSLPKIWTQYVFLRYLITKHPTVFKVNSWVGFDGESLAVGTHSRDY